MNLLLETLLDHLRSLGRIEFHERSEHFARLMVITPDGIIAERDLYYDQLHHAHDLKALVDELREEVLHRQRLLQDVG
ncbi:hypothetical protein [Pseudomonas oryzihabitans]|uniref:hypothetical protein n=1 Tax=Pseudomonas oryzihabitans TaxID=47885 RepID=UPI0028955970|nr:hypothetical protein [Pseudomonas oryzihabitans]MDT3718027.1 hypothetical protein [Pseudomonas oryzihabitans]